MRLLIGTMLVMVAALSATGARAASERYSGVSALPGAPSNASATLLVTHTGPLDASLDLVEHAGSSVIRDYDLDMTQRLHLILISDDFATFEHLHPDLATSGHFTIALHVPRSGRYFLYADGEPHGIAHSVFRFAVDFGNAPHRSPVLTATERSVHVGPYLVTLDGLSLRTGGETMIGVRIERNRHPATDLEPYLGGAAHAVLIDAATLAYLHVHPETGSGSAAMSSMTGMSGMAAMDNMRPLSNGSHVSPSMKLHVGSVAAGRYKLWLQFRGGGQLYVAPFVLEAR